MNQERLYKSRSAKACLTAANTVFVHRFKIIFKATWIRVVLFALTTALYLSFTRLYLPLHGSTDDHSLVHLSAATVLLLTVLFAYPAGMKAYVEAIGGSRSCLMYGGMVWSVVILSLLVIGIASGTSYLSDRLFITNKELALLTHTGIFAFLIGILAPPLLFICIRHLVLRHRKKHKVSLTSSLGRCFRYGGILYITFILAALMTLLAAALPSLPMIVIGLARHASIHGMESGDAAGFTTSFYYAYFGTTFLTAFLLAYLSYWFFTVNAYCFGAIEYDERERVKADRMIPRARQNTNV